MMRTSLYSTLVQCVVLACDIVSALLLILPTYISAQGTAENHAPPISSQFGR